MGTRDQSPSLDRAMINHGESAVSQNTWYQGREPRAAEEAWPIFHEFARTAQFCS
jgi:hypothetical protein